MAKWKNVEDPTFTEPYYQALRKGLTRGDAARRVGLHQRTIADWIKKGKDAFRNGDTENPYCVFYLRTRDAERGLKLLALDRVWTTIEDDEHKDSAATARWVLERRFPEEWKPVERREITGADGAELKPVATLYLPEISSDGVEAEPGATDEVSGESSS